MFLWQRAREVLNISYCIEDEQLGCNLEKQDAAGLANRSVKDMKSGCSGVGGGEEVERI